MSCQGPIGIWSSLFWAWLLREDVEQQLNATVYLQTRDWAVRMTSDGLGCLPSWTTKFLCVQIAHKVVKIPWRYFVFSYSSFLCFRRSWLIHCCTDTSPRSEVCTARGVPCQVALAKGQNNNKWEKDSSSSSRKGHELATRIPLFFKVRKVGKLSWQSLHTKLPILTGTWTFQIICHRFKVGSTFSLEIKL